MPAAATKAAEAAVAATQTGDATAVTPAAAAVITAPRAHRRTHYRGRQ